MIRISEDEYRDHVDAYDGVCLACGEWSEGGVEPDAEEYKCCYCGKRRVVGAEQALILDAIEVAA